MVVRLRRNFFSNLFWAFAIFGFCFQCYFPKLSDIIVPCLIIFLILEAPSMTFERVKGWTNLYGIWIFYLLISLIVALLSSGLNYNSFRFLTILLIIPLAEIIEEKNFSLEWRTFQLLMVARVIPVAYTWIILFITKNFSPYREWALLSGAGDIYIINGIPRIQLRGSSLFVVGFLIDFYKRKKIDLFNVLMIAGALISGNAAYVLGIAVGLLLFFLPREKNIAMKSWKFIILIPLLAIGIAFFAKYSISSLNEKAGSANAIRSEQASVLLDTNPVIGRGLGHPIVKTTSTRNYNGDTYFELQTLYIFNQVGLVGLLFFYILTITPYLGVEKRYQLYAYLSYLIYTFWNPYCFDSTHIITVILITNSLAKLNEGYNVK